MQEIMCYNKIKKAMECFMDNYKLTFGIEPTDTYEKAKQDLLQAWKSIRELSPEEQRVLAEEFFGAAQVAAAVEMFGKCFG